MLYAIHVSGRGDQLVHAIHVSGQQVSKLTVSIGNRVVRWILKLSGSYIQGKHEGKLGAPMQHATGSCML
eukprot:jgi/Chrzof1/1436/Cz10g07270.t1